MSLKLFTSLISAFFIFNLAPLKMDLQASAADSSTETVKKKYSFKKGRKNQKALEQIRGKR